MSVYSKHCTGQMYYMSKMPLPMLNRKLLDKIGQDFLDIWLLLFQEQNIFRSHELDWINGLRWVKTYWN